MIFFSEAKFGIASEILPGTSPEFSSGIPPEALFWVRQEIVSKFPQELLSNILGYLTEFLEKSSLDSMRDSSKSFFYVFFSNFLRNSETHLENHSGNPQKKNLPVFTQKLLPDSSKYFCQDSFEYSFRSSSECPFWKTPRYPRDGSRPEVYFETPPGVLLWHFLWNSYRKKTSEFISKEAIR